MRLRFLMLPLAAAVIVGLCAYKLTRTYGPAPVGSVPVTQRQPPLFELLDQSKPSEMVRLSRYLGRHTILVVFFDGRAGFDRDETLMRLARHAERLKARGVVVLGISDALPQHNRAIVARLRKRKILEDEFPFPLLSDPGRVVHRAWGRYDRDTGKPLPGVFLIDRAGRVAWGETGPRPLTDPATAVDELIGG